MAVRVSRDPDNKWFLTVDWSDWLADKASDSGDTVALANSAWVVPSAITQEAETTYNVASGKTFFVGSGGTVDTEYTLVNRITYSVSALSLSDATQDKTITIRIVEDGGV